MKILQTEIYEEFECIGGNCPKTCCGGWTISIDEKTYQMYSELPEPERNWILDKIKSENEKELILNEDGRCPFLNEEGWCLVYRKIGPEALSHICKFYPRLIHQYNDLITITVSLACPEVARIVLNKKNNIQVFYSENDDNLLSEDFDWILYNELVNGLVLAIEILQNDSLSIVHKLLIVLDMAEIIDTCREQNRIKDARDKLNKLLRPDNLSKRLFELDNLSVKMTNYGDFISSCFSIIKLAADNPNTRIFKDLYHPNFKGNKHFEHIKMEYEDFINNTIEYSNISMLILFENWMKCLQGESLYAIVSKIILYLMILKTQEIFSYNDKGELTELNRTLLISNLSKVLEHSQMVNILDELIVKNNGKTVYYDIVHFL